MDESLARYARVLTRASAAESYSTKYERIWHKRLSDRRERAVIARAIALAGPPFEGILDAPSGAGRLCPELVPHGGPITALDYSPEQLAIGRGRSPVPLRSIRGNILALPFRAGSFELVFSARISHHIGSESDREAWLRELMRVSSRAVVATVFDRESLKNRLRELRRRLGSGKRSKFTMSLSRVRELAAGAGFELVAAPAIAPLLSGHRYLVLSRTR